MPTVENVPGTAAQVSQRLEATQRKQATAAQGTQMCSAWRITEHGEHCSVTFDARLAAGTPPRAAPGAPDPPQPPPPTIPSSPARSAGPAGRSRLLPLRPLAPL